MASHVRIAGYSDRERQRVTFTVDGVSGDYANERLTFGVVASGVIPDAFSSVAALIEGGPDGSPEPSGIVVELWLPRIAGTDKSADQLTDADYFFAGNVLAPAGVAKSVTGANTVQFGSATWNLGAWPGAQLRVKSGPASGTVTVSASAY